MVRKYIILLSLIMFLVPSFPSFGQSAPQNSNLLKSELSSAVSQPCIIVGRNTGNWAALATIPNPTSGDPVNPDAVFASLAWSGNTPSANVQPTTCTWTISSVAPGPAQFFLRNSLLVPTTNALNIDSTTGVINVTDNPRWFPINAGGYYDPTQFTEVGLQPMTFSYWANPKDVQDNNNYPPLQWGAMSISLIYQ